MTFVSVLLECYAHLIISVNVKMCNKSNKYYYYYYYYYYYLFHKLFQTIFSTQG